MWQVVKILIQMLTRFKFFNSEFDGFEIFTSKSVTL